MDFSIECSNLTCGYHGKTVLHSVDLSCRAGEVLALLGPNGSGKSTLIRALGGFLQVDSGSVQIGGRDLTTLNERQIAAMLATVPQEEAHRFPFTVGEVVAMGRLPASTSFFDTEEDIEISREGLVEAGCETLADRLIVELSGGERQRVLIARALAQRTPGILLDEPTAHLDVAHQLSCANLFRSLAAKGAALVVAAHDLNLAGIMADRAILLQNGRVAADLSMEQLLESDVLDAVYEVSFERIRSQSGVLRVYPNLPVTCRS